MNPSESTMEQNNRLPGDEMAEMFKGPVEQVAEAFEATMNKLEESYYEAFENGEIGKAKAMKFMAAVVGLGLQARPDVINYARTTHAKGDKIEDRQKDTDKAVYTRRKRAERYEGIESSRIQPFHMVIPDEPLTYQDTYVRTVVNPVTGESEKQLITETIPIRSLCILDCCQDQSLATNVNIFNSLGVNGDKLNELIGEVSGFARDEDGKVVPGSFEEKKLLGAVEQAGTKAQLKMKKNLPTDRYIAFKVLDSKLTDNHGNPTNDLTPTSDLRVKVESDREPVEGKSVFIGGMMKASGSFFSKLNGIFEVNPKAAIIADMAKTTGRKGFVVVEATYLDDDGKKITNQYLALAPSLGITEPDYEGNSFYQERIHRVLNPTTRSARKTTFIASKAGIPISAPADEGVVKAVPSETGWAPLEWVKNASTTSDAFTALNGFQAFVSIAQKNGLTAVARVINTIAAGAYIFTGAQESKLPFVPITWKGDKFAFNLQLFALQGVTWLGSMEGARAMAMFWNYIVDDLAPNFHTPGLTNIVALTSRMFVEAITDKSTSPTIEAIPANVYLEYDATVRESGVFFFEAVNNAYRNKKSAETGIFIEMLPPILRRAYHSYPLNKSAEITPKIRQYILEFGDTGKDYVKKITKTYEVRYGIPPGNKDSDELTKLEASVITEAGQRLEAFKKAKTPMEVLGKLVEGANGDSGKIFKETLASIVALQNTYGKEWDFYYAAIESQGANEPSIIAVKKDGSKVLRKPFSISCVANGDPKLIWKETSLDKIATKMDGTKDMMRVGTEEWRKHTIENPSSAFAANMLALNKLYENPEKLPDAIKNMKPAFYLRPDGKLKEVSLKDIISLTFPPTEEQLKGIAALMEGNAPDPCTAQKFGELVFANASGASDNTDGAVVYAMLETFDYSSHDNSSTSNDSLAIASGLGLLAASEAGIVGGKEKAVSRRRALNALRLFGAAGLTVAAAASNPVMKILFKGVEYASQEELEEKMHVADKFLLGKIVGDQA